MKGYRWGKCGVWFGRKSGLQASLGTFRYLAYCLALEFVYRISTDEQSYLASMVNGAR